MDNKLVKLYTARDNIEAEMLLEALDNSHIPAYKKELGSAGIMNLYSGNSKDGEDIFVAEQDIQKAKEVLQGMGLE